MPNEFVARNGIIALNNSSITGSLNVTSSAVSTIAGNPTFDGDSILTIKNNNPSSFPTQVLALDSVRSDTPVDIKLGSSTPKGIRIYADNQVLTSSPAGAGFQFYRITDTNFPGQVYFDSGAHNNAAIIFRTAITSGTITERARFTSAGRLLIGTSTESTFELDVVGDIRSTLDANINGLTVGKGGGSFSTNTAFGVSALAVNTTGGANNVAIGNNALALNTSAGENTALGSQAGNKITTGYRNTSIGYRSFNALTTGIENVSVGAYNAEDITTAKWNTIIGYNTGRGITTGDGNTIIGAQVSGLSSSLSNTIILADGQGNQRLYINNSGNVGIGTTSPNARLDVSGSAIITGSLTVTQGITGSLLGTASLATTASNALTASFVQNAISASFASTASFVTTAQTASFVQNAVSASFAATASSADNFLVRGTLTAQTIVVQEITSSRDFVTGSTRFGSLLANTHQFTGSVSITGSLTTNGDTTISGSTVISGSFTVFTGSAVEFQVTNTGVRIGNVSTDVHTVTGSLNASGSTHIISGSTNLFVGNSSNSFLVRNTTGSFISTSQRAGGFTTVNILTLLGGRFILDDSGGDGGNASILRRSVNELSIYPADHPVFSGAVSIRQSGSATPILHVVQTTGGNVGVNNNSPLYKLDVTGEFRNTSGSYLATSAGNVLIGTTTNAGYKLDVQGTLRNTTDAYLNTTSGNTSIGKTTANAKLDVNGSTIISGSFTVFTGSAVELQVTNTGVRIGNVTTDVHTVTGSFNVSGSVTATGSVNIVGSLNVNNEVQNISFYNAAGSQFIGSIGRNSAASLNVQADLADLRLGVGGFAGNIVLDSTARAAALIRLVSTSGTIVSSSFTVFTGSAVEFQVTNTGVRIGNASTDTHTVTGSFNISGSGFVHGGGFIVSGTLETSGSTSQGLVAPLKFTTGITGSYTLVRTDEGKMVELNGSGIDFLVTIPTNASVPFPIGTEISFFNIGSDSIATITGSTGVTVLFEGFKQLNYGGAATVLKRNTDTWYLFGNLI